MKTNQYNPSPLELDFKTALHQVTNHLGPLLPNYQIEAVDVLKESDNPILLYKILDSDGDRHELILQVIQRPDGINTNSGNY